jgi:hypothetical protein
MTELTYTLLGDGASDEVLLRHLAWLIEQSLNPGISTRPQWADLRAYRIKPSGLTSRIRAALTLYPCDLLFVHLVVGSDRGHRPPLHRRFHHFFSTASSSMRIGLVLLYDFTPAGYGCS